MLVIPAKIRETICRHAASAYARECCGLLIGSRDADGNVLVSDASPAENTAPNDRQHHRYAIEPLEIVHADRRAREHRLDIVGVYHSHPDHPAVPSAADLALAWEGYVYLILAVTAAGIVDMRAWVLDGAEPKMQELALANV